MDYVFRLNYQLPPVVLEIDALIEQLAEAGCDDALIGSGREGRLSFEFTRSAESANDALYSALSQIHSVIPTAQLIEAKPDYVGLTDIGNILGMSRQGVRKLLITHANTFPLPIHEGSIAIWRLAQVLNWFDQRGYAIEASLKEMSLATLTVNAARPGVHLHGGVDFKVDSPMAFL